MSFVVVVLFENNMKNSVSSSSFMINMIIIISVTIECLSREMVARVKSTKMFNGKLYSKTKPNSCVTDVSNSMEFEIKMNYHELECDVKQEVSIYLCECIDVVVLLLLLTAE